MTNMLLSALVVTAGVATIYVASKSRDFVKFLAGAFFVSGGIQLYLSVMGVSVPILGTHYMQTPELGVVRAVIHLLLFVVTFWLGFVKQPKASGRW